MEVPIPKHLVPAAPIADPWVRLDQTLSRLLGRPRTLQDPQLTQLLKEKIALLGTTDKSTTMDTTDQLLFKVCELLMQQQDQVGQFLEQWRTMSPTLLPLAPFEGHKSIWALAFSPDSSLIASGCDDGPITLWRVATGQPVHILQGHTYGTIQRLAFNQEGTQLASASGDHTVRLWDVAKGTQIARITLPQEEFGGRAFSPDLRLFSWATHKGVVNLWSLPDGKEIGQVLVPLLNHKDSTFSSDGKLVAIAGCGQPIVVWDRIYNEKRCTLDGDPNGNRLPIFFHNDARLVAVLPNDQVGLWCLKTTNRLLSVSWQTRGIWVLAISADSRWLVAAGASNQLPVWETETGELVRPGNAETTDVHALAISPDGKMIASGCGKRILLTDFDRG